jgi:tetratricopeptide (TPR) repeat protein
LADGKGADAIKLFRQAVMVRERLVSLEPDNISRMGDVVTEYENIAEALAAERDHSGMIAAYKSAVAVRERIASLVENAEVAAAGSPGTKTAEKLGSLAWGALLARQFDLALASSQRATALAPDLIWLQTNLAHALMFLDRRDEARAVFLSYRGKSTANGKPWEHFVLEDFGIFRRADLTSPLMEDIERALNAKS